MTLAAMFTVALGCTGCNPNRLDPEKPATPTTTQQQNDPSTAPAEARSPAKPAATTSTQPALTAAQQRGELVFKKAYCVGCHAGGNNAMMPDKPIKGAAFSQKYKDDAVLESTIRKGFPDEGMPAFDKEQIPESKMKDLILYIRSFTPTK
ncbi:MAG: c-type cytochrome [Candidatus Melainabacteria bacterium]|nr:c-type cytochrome [Candidatus Melainabacteria bacterium]